MHPKNVPCLAAAAIDCCALANNHVLDWGRAGLAETLTALRGAGIRTAGAGGNASAAAAPAVIEHRAGTRMLVFAFATEGSGVTQDWRATRERSGVNLIDDLSAGSADAIAAQVAAHRRSGDIVIASIHWGGNWGYEIPEHQREFAHRLIDAAGVDLVHGHSSHHAKGIEVYRGKAILYGCGDMLNDYEGIGGYERFRGDLALMYFPTLDAASGALKRLSMTPTRTHRFRINRAPPEAGLWLSQTLDRECRRMGGRVEQQADGTLELKWG
jgi:poly-gamma-glutamate synthesis protein (capsule biosynthesis protein)